MRWIKRGQIYQFNPIDEFLQSHASNPLAVHLQDDIFRVFFSGRDCSNKSSVGYVDIDIVEEKVVNTCTKCIFQYGNENSFYSHGISIGNMYKVKDVNFMQFMAWQIRGDEHWKGDIGRFEVCSDLESLKLNPDAPYLTCDNEDKISLSYSWVILDEGIYKMWYGSTIDWTSENGEMIHVIKYATSKDGEKWKRHGIAIDYEIGKAQAFSRPTVLKDEKGYHMWYSFRSGNGTKYRIGYAFSSDSVRWERKDDSGINVSESGWDSEMICYPFVFKHKDTTYMLYNGNEYGKYGFGLAILEEKIN